MSNLLKNTSVIENGHRVIDYNDFIFDKIEAIKKQAIDGGVDAGFVSGLNAATVESLIGDDDVQAGVDGDTLSAEEPVGDENDTKTLEDADTEARRIIEEAESTAAQIREAAKAEAEQIKADAKNAGYEDGMKQGMADGTEHCEAEYASRAKQLEDEYRKMEDDYQKKYDEIEPQIVSTVLDVIGKVTGVVYEANKDILIHLINRVLKDVEASNEYVIKVSHADYQFLIEKQSKLYAASAKDMNIDIVEDSSLSAGQCVIETDGGIFDCSLDVTMNQLVNDIKMLAGV